MSKFKVMLLSAFLVVSMSLTSSSVYAGEDGEEEVGALTSVSECGWVCTFRSWF